MTSSRLRSPVVTYFDVCCEVSCGNSETSGCVKVLYPVEYNDEGILHSIKQFCFPTKNIREECDAVQLFTFVLTDAQSQYTFGYCRMTPLTNICLCILSGLNWTTHFYKFLNHLSNVINKGTKEDLESLLTNAYHVDITEIGNKLKLTACTKIGKFEDEIFNNNKLLTFQNDKSMLEFYNAISEKQMIPLFSSLLKERRIIFTGRKLNQLSSCVFALVKLLYPFNWQNLFIPVLPIDLTDMLMAPMPYIIGVPKQTFRNLNKSEFGEVVIFDLDEKTFESSNNDTLPLDVNFFLKSQLKLSSEIFLSDRLPRLFLQGNVLIFGKYTSGINEKFIFNKKIFVNSQRSSIQPFLSSILLKDGVQYFERFIEERLDALNKGNPIIDEFERELNRPELKKILNRPINITLPAKPEVFQQAVTNVKENANDVYEALKDLMQAISIKDKIGKFTPKEVRKNKFKQLKKKKNISSLTIDTSFLNSSNSLSNSNMSTINKFEENVSDAESVCSTKDLINFLDNDQNNLPSIRRSSVSPSSSSTIQQQNQTLVENLNEIFLTDLTSKVSHFQTFDNFETNTNNKNNQHLTSQLKKKNNWEKFE